MQYDILDLCIMLTFTRPLLEYSHYVVAATRTPFFSCWSSLFLFQSAPAVKNSSKNKMLYFLKSINSFTPIITFRAVTFCFILFQNSFPFPLYFCCHKRTSKKLGKNILAPIRPLYLYFSKIDVFLCASSRNCIKTCQ